MGDDVVGIDEVLLRFRHLFDGTDRDGFARGDFRRRSRITFALEVDLGWQQPLDRRGIRAPVGFVNDHTLSEERRERLLDVLGGSMASRRHCADKKARVEQVQDRVLDTADILVDGQPVVDGLLIDRRRGVRRGKAGKIPGAVDERIHGVRLARRWFGAGWTGDVFPSRVAVKRVTGLVERGVFRQHNRHVRGLDRDDAASCTVDNRDRAAPIALA